MFQETIEDVLEFIALHGEGGCDGAALFDFVSRDVLPHYGLPGGAPLQHIVVGLVATDPAAAAAIAVHRASEGGGSVPVPAEELTRVGPGDAPRYTVRPLLELQERVLGMSLRHSKILRDAVNCACANFVDGFHRNRPAPRDKRGSVNAAAIAGVGGRGGVRQLLREQFLRVAYILDRPTPGGTALLVPNCYPHFAAPAASLTSSARRPIDAYISRRRAELLPGRVHLDLRAVRGVIAAAPERRLVYEDAVHAILAAHGLENSETWALAQGRRLRNSLKRMLSAAGLRIVHVRLLNGRYRRSARVVVLACDITARGGRGNEDHSNAKESDDDNKESDGDGEGDGDDDDDRAGEGKTWDEEELDAKDDDGDDENDKADGDDDDDDNDKEEDGDDEDNNNAGDEESEGSEESEGDGTGVASPFAIDPSLPLSLQVAKEAERGPLSLVSVLPRIVFFNMRLIDKELLRYTKNYETRWGTIVSTRVRSPHSKAFTILLSPAGSDAAVGAEKAHMESAACLPTTTTTTTTTTTATTTGTTAEGIKEEREMKGSGAGPSACAPALPPLPRGVSQWSVDRVLDALRASPRGVLSLPVLSRVVDRTTLGRRLLPFLRSVGIVTTTGATTPNGVRVGLVALAGADLSEDVRNAVARECAQLLAGRQRRESPVVLQHIPLTAGRASERCERLVARAVVVRNGFARDGTARAARLHCELWRVWYTLGIAPSTALSLARVLSEMSLGAFCVVAGLHGVDAAAFVRDGSAAWGTPLRLLPPSLRAHCGGAARQPLLHALAALQRHRLIAEDPPIAAYMRHAAETIMITLRERGGDGCAADFTSAEVEEELKEEDEDLDEDEEEEKGKRRTRRRARATCRAVLRYWAERLSASAAPREHQRAAPLLREAAATEPDISTVQLVALAHALRIDVAALAEYVAQRCGAVPAPCRGLLDALVPSRALSFRSLAAHAANRKSRAHNNNNNNSSSSRRHGRSGGGEEEEDDDDDEGLQSAKAEAEAEAEAQPMHARAVRRRFELTAATVAEALDAALHSADAPAAVGRIADALRRAPLPLEAHRRGAAAAGGSRAHAGAQHIVRAVEAAVRNGTDVASAIASVAAPNFAAPPLSALPDAFLAHNVSAVPYASDAGAAALLTSEPPEALQDAMRMILLSDEAHYDAAAARAVLSPYSDAARRHCARWLALRPAFRGGAYSVGGASAAHLRVAGVDVSPALSLAPPTVIAAAMYDSSATAAFAHTVAAAMLAMSPSPSRAAVPHFDFGDESLFGSSYCTHSYSSHSSHSSPPPPAPAPVPRAPRVVSQPTLDVNSLAVEIRQQRGLAVLRLPRFVWPAPRNAEPPQQQQQQEQEEQQEEKGQQEELKKEEQKNPQRSVGRRAEPHPARAVLRSWKRVSRVGLGDIPADPPPTSPFPFDPSSSAAAPSAAPSSGPSGVPPGYPSVFHHVDGAFHEFLWRAFLLLAYALVQRQPGIAENELTQRMAASGVASRAACQKVLDFLTASLVLVKRRVVAETQRSPFAVAAENADAGALRECYFCTLPQDGPWRILEL